jgi:hypothetical protein
METVRKEELVPGLEVNMLVRVLQQAPRNG